MDFPTITKGSALVLAVFLAILSVKGKYASSDRRHILVFCAFCAIWSLLSLLVHVDSDRFSKLSRERILAGGAAIGVFISLTVTGVFSRCRK
jgi:hypothetical protein